MRVDLDAPRIEGHVDPAGLPETRVAAHEFVVRHIDEHLERDALAVLVEFIARDLSGLQAPEIDRRTDVERSEILGVKHEFPAGRIRSEGGRLLEADEIALWLALSAKINADIWAGEQSAKP